MAIDRWGSSRNGIVLQLQRSRNTGATRVDDRCSVARVARVARVVGTPLRLGVSVSEICAYLCERSRVPCLSFDDRLSGPVGTRPFHQTVVKMIFCLFRWMKQRRWRRTVFCGRTSFALRCSMFWPLTSSPRLPARPRSTLGVSTFTRSADGVAALSCAQFFC